MEGLKGKEEEVSKKEVPVTCSWCGNEFFLKPSIYKNRMRLAKHGVLYCSKACVTAKQEN